MRSLLTIEQMGQILLLEERRIWQHDRVHAHQEPLHEEPQANQSFLDHARGPRAAYSAVGRGGTGRESGFAVEIVSLRA